MENNHHIHSPRSPHLIDFERAKLAINFGHGVVNVRKGEENRQTNSSVALAELMIIVEHERRGGLDMNDAEEISVCIKIWANQES